MEREYCVRVSYTTYYDFYVDAESEDSAKKKVDQIVDECSCLYEIGDEIGSEIDLVEVWQTN